MSRWPRNAVRNHLRYKLLLTALFTGQPVLAQDDSAVTQDVQNDPNVIDILVRPETDEVDQVAQEQCERDQEAALISREIVVCAPPRDQSQYRTTSDSAKRYAEETMLKGAPRAPDFILDCADQGWPPGCVRIGKVPPPALIIDVEALPQAPPGSDADRISRGLAPLGDANPVGDGVIDTLAENDRDAPINTGNNTGPVIDYASTIQEEASAISSAELAAPEARQ